MIRLARNFWLIASAVLVSGCGPVGRKPLAGHYELITQAGVFATLDLGADGRYRLCTTKCVTGTYKVQRFNFSDGPYDRLTAENTDFVMLEKTLCAREGFPFQGHETVFETSVIYDRLGVEILIGPIVRDRFFKPG
jgi:hypothetical protein